MTSILPHWLIGVLCSILSSCLGSYGKVLLRYCHIREENENHKKITDLRPSLLMDITNRFSVPMLQFVSYLLIIIVNPILSTLSYVYAAQSLVSPFAGLSIVWTFIFSSFLLPEIISYSQLFSSILIMIGCILVSIFGNHDNPSYTANELQTLSTESLFSIYILLFIVYSMILVYCILSNKNNIIPYKKFAYGLLSGSLGGNQIYIKSLTCFITIFLMKHQNIFIFTFFYTSVIMSIVTALGGIIILNNGLKYYDALYLIPMYQGSFIVFGALSAVCFFKETIHITQLSGIMYLLGILFNISGLYVLNIPYLSDQMFGFPRNTNKEYIILQQEEKEEQIIITSKL